MYEYEPTDPAERKSDRVLVLKAINDKPKNSQGLVDYRLFTGENKLHAIMDKQTSLWYFKYDNGVLPAPLKQHFTSFKKAREFVTAYMKRRNIEIVEIID